LLKHETGKEGINVELNIKFKLSTVLLIVALIINLGELLIINNYFMANGGWNPIMYAGIPWLLSLLCLFAGIVLSLTEKR
jgi:hypothetical protein